MSSEINWGSGSGQQSVTSTLDSDKKESLWLVNNPDGMAECETGEVINCNSILRLQHLSTGKNLHSHSFRSPLTGQQEVSGFGAEGTGDISDNWQLLCETSANKSWEVGSPFRLKHVDTGKFLASSSQSKFTNQNCPNCPIVGQLEVAATSKMGEGSRWVVQRGVMVSMN